MNNQVKLLGHYGSDKTHALAAWSSTFLELNIEIPERIEDRVDVIVNYILANSKRVRTVEQLLLYLAVNEHTSPFRFSSFHFVTTTEIATHIQFLKHAVAMSAESAECLTGDSLITFTYGNKNRVKKRQSIESLYNLWENGRSHQQTKKDSDYGKKLIKKRFIRVLNTKTGEFEKSHIKDIWYKGEQDVYLIKLSNNKSIKCTTNHKIYTNKGFITINEGLKVGDLVGVNGISINVEGKPYTFESFYNNASSYTRKEFASKHRLSYELIKKWGYIFNISFKLDENKDFKKGSIPWNKNVKGYKIDIKNRKHNPLKGMYSNFWRGGVTSDRAKVTTWTAAQAVKVHKKYNYTCQKCGQGSSDLHCHHIIPVCVDISKAYDFNNLITVCKKCHYKIHSNQYSEKQFASEVLSLDYEILNKTFSSYQKKQSKKRTSFKVVKKVHFKEVVSIEYVGKEKTYDIEVEGEHNNFIANNIVVHNSARYKELKEDKFYLPEDWLEFGELGVKWFNKLKQQSEDNNRLYHECLKDLVRAGVPKNRAKESARFFKMYNAQLNSSKMFTFDGLLQVYKKRNLQSPSQLEIGNVVEAMMQEVKNIPGNPFKHSLNAFGIF